MTVLKFTPDLRDFKTIASHVKAATSIIRTLDDEQLARFREWALENDRSSGDDDIHALRCSILVNGKVTIARRKRGSFEDHL